MDLLGFPSNVAIPIMYHPQFNNIACKLSQPIIKPINNMLAALGCTCFGNCLTKHATTWLKPRFADIFLQLLLTCSKLHNT